MRCPFCSAPAYEGIGECPHCGFSLTKLDAIFGTVPRVTPGISDFASLFSDREKRKLQSALYHFHKRFPQVTLHIVTNRLRPGENLPAWAFWIFNRAGISRSVDVGGENRNALLCIDAENARAAIIVGYGLEPFVGEQHLQDVVASAANDYRGNRFFEGTQLAINSLDQVLSRICSGLDRTYGVNLADLHRHENRQSQTPEPDAPQSPY